MSVFVPYGLFRLFAVDSLMPPYGYWEWAPVCVDEATDRWAQVLLAWDGTEATLVRSDARRHEGHLLPLGEQQAVVTVGPEAGTLQVIQEGVAHVVADDRKALSDVLAAWKGATQGRPVFVPSPLQPNPADHQL